MGGDFTKDDWITHHQHLKRIASRIGGLDLDEAPGGCEESYHEYGVGAVDVHRTKGEHREATRILRQTIIEQIGDGEDIWDGDTQASPPDKDSQDTKVEYSELFRTDSQKSLRQELEDGGPPERQPYDGAPRFPGETIPERISNAKAVYGEVQEDLSYNRFGDVLRGEGIPGPVVERVLLLISGGSSRDFRRFRYSDRHQSIVDEYLSRAFDDAWNSTRMADAFHALFEDTEDTVIRDHLPVQGTRSQRRMEDVARVAREHGEEVRKYNGAHYKIGSDRVVAELSGDVRRFLPEMFREGYLGRQSSSSSDYDSVLVREGVI